MPFSFNKDKLEINQEFMENNKSFPRINISLAPNPLLNFSKDQLYKISEEAAENDLLIHIHIEEDKSEKNKSIKKYNLTPLELIANSGLLDRKIVLAHSTNFTDNELKILSKYQNVGISFNPKSNFKLSNSTAPLAKMLEYKLTVGFGTDGAGSSNSLDLFDQINFAAFTARCENNKNYCANKNSINPEKLIRMATIEGAKVLGLERKIGSIEVGKKADIILVDFSQANLTPSFDIYSSLVYNTDGSNVSDSIIDGKIVMKDRKLPHLNEKEIMEKVSDIANRIKHTDQID
jgi:5-methylthioadenosine/S-adenosylhomocysteine deaminase